MRYSTISQIGAFTALSAATPDWLRLIPSRCDGGEDPNFDLDTEKAAGQPGMWIFGGLDSDWIITLAGDFQITSDGADPGYLAAQTTLLGALLAALGDMKAAPGDLVSDDGTLSCWKYGKLTKTFDETSKIMSVTFGLQVDNAPSL